jgi:hypothetical protein
VYNTENYYYVSYIINVMVDNSKIIRIKYASTHSIIVRIDYYPISAFYVDY